MKKWYKMAGMLLAGSCIVTQANAQTHYGQDAGTQGFQHAFFGVEAGKDNTGWYNTFIGHSTGTKNTTGTSNTFVGSSAGHYADTGSFNTLVGNMAGYNNNGNYNTFLGFAAGTVSKGGHENTFLGSGAGNQNFGGNQNTFLGRNAGSGDSHGNENVIVGYKSGQLSGGVDTGNAFFGSQSGYENKGNYNCFFGFKAGFTNTSGNGNTYLGYMSGGNPTLTNATAIGANAKVESSNSVVLGASNATVGIGVTAPFFQLQLSTSAAAKPGSPNWSVISDSRLKRNVTDFTDGLELLKQIRPVRFQYNGKAGIQTGDKQFVGIIAQEMQKVAPYTIDTFIHQDSLGNKTEYLDYDANAVIYILINSVKEQQQVIEQKDAELKEVNAQVAALSKRLEQLERVMASNTAKPLTGNLARQEPNANGVILEQNVPNGFSGISAINFFIPQSVQEASVNVYSVNGVKLHSYPVKARGDGQLTISAEQFQNGVFLYDLVTDGKSNGVKKMVIQK